MSSDGGRSDGMGEGDHERLWSKGIHFGAAMEEDKINGGRNDEK